MRIGDKVTYQDAELGEMLGMVSRLPDGKNGLASDEVDLNLYTQHGDGDENVLLRGVVAAKQGNPGEVGTWHENDVDNVHNIRAMEAEMQRIQAKIDKRKRR